jgi:putative DNA primase/helicase
MARHWCQTRRPKSVIGLAAQWREQRARADAARRREAAAAAEDAGTTWRRAIRLVAAARGVASAYLQRKGVTPEACRILDDGTVVVPMIRYDTGELVGVQKIAPDGSKRFGFGTAKQGAACRLGAIDDEVDVIFFARGMRPAVRYGRRLRFGAPVFVAFDAGNLATVVEILRERYPRAVFGICADDDYLSGEAGWKKAIAAARKFPLAFALRPVFEQRKHGVKWTDFNDLAVNEGMDAAAAQLQAFLMFCRREAVAA